ncbi:MAG: SRPBCC family protein [Cyanobacteria bacterium P01_D01_bin.115]|mgnify:CR=1 FL=1
MATIHKQFKINAAVDHVWKKMSDVSNIHTFLSMLANSELQGDTRVCTTQDGAQVKELIVSIDSDLKRLVYGVTESPFGLEFHSSSWQAIPDDDGTIFEWYTDVKPDGMAEAMEQMIEGERENIIRGLAA